MTQSSAVIRGGQKRLAAAGTRLGWRDVLAAIQDGPERSGLVKALGDAGFSVDEFGTLKKPRELACTWLSRYEDRLDGRRGEAAWERARCCGVRRRLERDLWP